MNDPGSRRHRPWLAWIWFAVTLAVGVHQVDFWRQMPIESDVMALLPQDANDPVLNDVTRRIADASAQKIVVLLGSADASGARAAAGAYRGALAALDRQTPLPFAESEAMAGWFDAARAFFLPWRDRLLTPEQRERLAQERTEALAQEALAALYGPIGAPRLAQWQVDPLNLWTQWWQSRAMAAGLRFDADGLLHAQDRVWAVLQLETRGSAFRLDGEPVIEQALDHAAAAARAVRPDLRELRAGVPLHAEAAAVRASGEMSLIGWGSLAAVLLLAWLAFGSLRPIMLVALSLLVGVATALSVTALVFGKVHLLTLVFGASLVGVAEDYGIHWFASRQAHPELERARLLRVLFPGLLLAWLTSALAYFALGLASIPGLQQMAVFSVAGLAAAFVTVVCWFPWIDRQPPPATRLSRTMDNWMARWPRMTPTAGWALLACLALGWTITGLLKLEANDDLRNLQSSPQSLVAQQVEISRLLSMPSPAQFYLVQAPDEETLLERERRLTARLAGEVARGRINGYRAISDWLPSRDQQDRDAALTRRVETAVLDEVAEVTGEALERAGFAAVPLTLPEWLASPASLPLRQLWLGTSGDGVASVVLVDALGGDEMLAALRAQADGLEGVRWVNRTAELSALLAHYRQGMIWLLLAGALLVALVLVARYRREAWRTGLPTLIASLLTVATLGWLGQPLQLFNVLALLLLIGMGIDYGIFLLEHRGDASAWLAVCVGAASTWLSFGLLALSGTPALRAFGLTLLLGIGLVWMISPLFRSRVGDAGNPARPQPDVACGDRRADVIP